MKQQKPYTKETESSRASYSLRLKQYYLRWGRQEATHPRNGWFEFDYSGIFKNNSTLFLKKTKHSNKLSFSSPRNGIPLWMYAHLPVKEVVGMKDNVFPASHVQKFNQARKVSKLVIKGKLKK